MMNILLTKYKLDPYDIIPYLYEYDRVYFTKDKCEALL